MCWTIWQAVVPFIDVEMMKMVLRDKGKDVQNKTVLQASILSARLLDNGVHTCAKSAALISTNC